MIRTIFTKVSLVIIAIIALCICGEIFNISGIARANSVNTDWSWANTKPTVYSSEPVTNASSSICKGIYRMKDIAGNLGLKNVCIYSDENTYYGTYFDSQGGIHSVIGFKYDSKMYKLNVPCQFYDSCLYLPDSDTLVTKQYLINGMVRSLVIYKNFSKHIKRTIDGVFIQYDFDSSEPDYTFRNANNYAWPIGGMGASDNGKWLAIEFRQRGIGLLNIDTLEMKRISTMAYSYGTGYDPTSELAVSDSGKQVAIMGINAGLTVFEVDEDCGDKATDEKMSDVRTINIPCKTSPIQTGDFINRFHSAYHPMYNYDGGELNFYATSYSETAREVSLRASGYSGQRIDYLAMGDSFTSGEGETEDKYYIRGTNDKYEKCHLSTRSYPYLIGSLSKIDPLYMKSVACSAATTHDVIGSDNNYLGQGNRLGENGLNLDANDKVFYKTQAKLSFQPGRIHQITFAKTYQPRVITIGIGGNDISLMDKLKTCLGNDVCYWAGTDEGKEKTALEIKAQFETFVKTYQKINTSSPKSRIYAVGYPKVIDQNGTCSLLIGKLLSNTERKFMNEGVIYLNEIIKAAARAAGIGYIDVQDSYGEHVLCGEAKPSAMSTIRTGDDNSPIDGSDWFKFIGQESFHPTPFGHEKVSELIYNNIGNILAHKTCNYNAIVCPSETTAPEPSSYWISGNVHNYPAQKNAVFTFDRIGSYDGKLKKILLDIKSLAPSSFVEIKIRSELTSLGQFYATDDGSLSVDVDLPNNLEEGYHTMHLYGTSYSGESIELYQVIEYRKPSPISVIPIVENTSDSSPNTTKSTDNDVKISATDNKTTTITTTDNNEPENELYDYNDTIAMSIDQEVKGDSTVANTLSKSEESTNPTLSNNNDETTEQNSNITTISLVIIAIFIPLLIAFFTVKLNKTNKNTKNKQKIM